MKAATSLPASGPLLTGTGEIPATTERGNPDDKPKDAKKEEEKKPEEPYVDVGEGRCSRCLGYSLAFPFLIMGVWCAYNLYLFREITLDSRYSLDTTVTSIIATTKVADSSISETLAPYYEHFLRIYLTTDLWTFYTVGSTNIIAMFVLAVFVFTLTYSKVNQHSFTALAFGNLTIRKYLRKCMISVPSVSTFYIALTFTSLYAAPFILAPVPSQATFVSVLQGSLKSPVHYFHFGLFSFAVSALSSSLVILYGFMTLAFMIFGPRQPDFEDFFQEQEQENKEKGVQAAGVSNQE